MAEESFEDVDISNIIEDTDQYFTSDHRMSEITESENINSIPNSEVLEPQEPVAVEKRPAPQKPEVVKTTQLPFSRIKSIMKMDPDVGVVSGDAVFLVTKATELFLETLAKETYAYTSSNKRKVVSKKDFDTVINKVDCLCFLEGTMDF